ncbi:hypothetical protein VQ042_18070 [Aurantimonas sp. A2-1-M11]|uniref:hypothetical protein n=1 Tax=Aurantimonas sp. A2-1-M11 TaxID=3113712 RepID=UPI002F95611F
MSADYGVALVGFLGALVGAAASFGGQWFSHHLETQRERKAVASAIAAEIDGYISLMNLRDHVTSAKRMAAAAQKGIRPDIGRLIAKHEIGAEQFPVIMQNLDKVGLLGELAGDISKFCRMVGGVRATIMSDIEGKYAKLSPSELGDLIEQEIALWEDAMALGRMLIRRLRAL